MRTAKFDALRGIGAISIILNNMWSNTFPHGYHGVDLFFVVTGYLTAMSFAKSESLSAGNILNFHYMRLKMIAFLCYCVLPLTVHSAQLYFCDFFSLSYDTIMFVVDAILLGKTKYLNEGLQYLWHLFITALRTDRPENVLDHIWMPSMLIIYYFLIPFILKGLSIVKNESTKQRILFGICALSYLHYISPLADSNLFSARLWQFGIGIFAFNVTDGKGKQEKKGNCNGCQFLENIIVNSCLVVMAALFVSFAFDFIYMGELITVATAVLLINDNEHTAWVYNIPLLAKLGKYFGMVYIMQWPVITIYKRFNPNGLIF